MSDFDIISKSIAAQRGAILNGFSGITGFDIQKSETVDDDYFEKGGKRVAVGTRVTRKNGIIEEKTESGWKYIGKEKKSSSPKPQSNSEHTEYVQHGLEDHERADHKKYMDKTHGVNTEFHGDDEVSYSGTKAQVKSVLLNHYGDEEQAEETHPEVFKKDSSSNAKSEKHSEIAQHVLDKDEYSDHTKHMKEKHGVDTKFSGKDDVEYSGTKEQVKNALIDHYDGEERDVKDLHPDVYENGGDKKKSKPEPKKVTPEPKSDKQEENVTIGKIAHNFIWPHQKKDHAEDMEKKFGVKTKYSRRTGHMEYTGPKKAVESAKNYTYDNNLATRGWNQ